MTGLAANMESVEPDQAACTFAVRGYVDPGTLPRVLGLFAQRGLVPRQVMFRRAEQWLLIDVEFDALDHGVGEILLHKLRAIPVVDRAELIL